MHINGVGKRFYTEIVRISLMRGEKPYELCKDLNIDNSYLYCWKKDETPSKPYIDKLSEVGADVDYILTGKEDDGKNE